MKSSELFAATQTGVEELILRSSGAFVACSESFKAKVPQPFFEEQSPSILKS